MLDLTAKELLTICDWAQDAAAKPSCAYMPERYREAMGIFWKAAEEHNRIIDEEKRGA